MIYANLNAVFCHFFIHSYPQCNVCKLWITFFIICFSTLCAIRHSVPWRMKLVLWAAVERLRAKEINVKPLPINFAGEKMKRYVGTIS